MHEAWQRASDNLEKVLPERDYNTWIKPLKYRHHEADTVYLSVPTSFFKEWLEDHYGTMIAGALSMASGRNLTIDFLVEENIQESEPPAPTEETAAREPEFKPEQIFTP